MRKKLLVRRLRAAGWYLLRQGATHEVWTNGSEQESLPRHTEVKENLAKKIVRRLKQTRR